MNGVVGRSRASCWSCSPLQASSGNKRHHRLNRGGNRQANATLHRIAVVRLRWHEQTKAYAERRKAEGLSSKEQRPRKWCNSGGSAPA